MASIVGAFIMPHEPGIFRTPAHEWTDRQANVRMAFETIKDRIGELRASSVIIVGSDHYVLFGPNCLPSFLIGTGDISGPYEKFPDIDQGQIPSNHAFSSHIAKHGRDNGLDWAVAKTLRVDHSIGIPARVCALPNECVKSIIPVYLASGVKPLISMQRAHEVGQGIRAAVEAWSGNERVVVIGSGGISHWIGMAKMGSTNETFDRWVLECVASGDVDALLCLDDDDVTERAGNGALEIRNYVCAMGSLPGKSGKIIAYENGPEWTAGLGFAEIR